MAKIRRSSVHVTDDGTRPVEPKNPLRNHHVAAVGEDALIVAAVR
jgi:hypothetical protein